MSTFFLKSSCRKIDAQSHTVRAVIFREMDCTKVSDNRQFAVCPNALRCAKSAKFRRNESTPPEIPWHRQHFEQEQSHYLCRSVYVFVRVKHVQTISPENQLDSTLCHSKLNLNQGCAKVCPAGCAFSVPRRLVCQTVPSGRWMCIWHNGTL